MASQIPPGADLCLLPSGPPPDGVMPNFVDPIDLSKQTLILSILLTVISSIFVTGRIIAHWRKMALADYLTILGFALTTSYSAIITASRDYTRHSWDLPACWYVADYIWKLLFSQNILLGITQFVLKTAILVYYFQLFAVDKKTRIAIRVGLVFCGLLYLPHPILVAIFNTPHKGERWADLATNGNPQKIAFYAPIHGVGSIILDIYIFALPLPILYHLHISPQKRLKLLAVFVVALLGVIASVFSCYWRIQILISAAGDYTWYEGQLFIWILVEHAVALVVGCMPAFAAFIKTKIIPSRLVSSFRTQLLGHTKQGISKSSFNRPTSSMQAKGAQGRQKNAFYYELDDSLLNTTVVVGVDDDPDQPVVPRTIDEEHAIMKTTKVLQESHGA
ncbi:hypothetical protein E0Z10_g10498 [Xylaria hypoxylon]|uniref:Rhodopsin domain-containing protein n=1 Tax=Xylaria hypoxylon TaxID=37992 RepID=A0A4Z0YH63_9PEZI|nr:hypothetical protein E0Z10_g10498 [Xylaria hypoxylon]